MNPAIIKLTSNFSIAPEIKDPSGFALYNKRGSAHAWINEDLATFSDGNEYTVRLDKPSRFIVLTNVTHNKSQIINY